MENIRCISHFTEKTDKAFKINEIRCFVMQSDRRLSGEKGVREFIGRTVTAG